MGVWWILARAVGMMSEFGWLGLGRNLIRWVGVGVRVGWRLARAGGVMSELGWVGARIG